MKRRTVGQGGFTLVELTVVLVVFTVIAISFFGLFVSLVHSTIIAKRQAEALSLATDQMEYLKSLPYDSLVVQSPSTSTKKIDGVSYTVTTTIKYVDDAYDGCGPGYNAQTPIAVYCRNYPPPSGSSTDLNPTDYKDARVSVTDSGGTKLATVDTQISARVAETASTTGALFVTVSDSSGTPVSGATVTVTNTTVSPNINKQDSTDSNGVVIFYGLTPDSGADYIISASKSGYSTLTTIASSGVLQPTYPNQKILNQQASYSTLKLQNEGSNSIVVEATDTSGNPISGAKIYMKGGYKKYTASNDTSYYYDNMTPNIIPPITTSDSRPVTDTSGLAAISNLVPGSYIFCGDVGATNCTVGGTTYYLAAAVPYGVAIFNPVTVPTGDSSGTTYTYGASQYLSKVRLLLTNSSSFPRISSLTPSAASSSDSSFNNFAFTISGLNLTCSANAGSCGTSVKFTQGSSTFTASCTGNSSPATTMSCTVNLSGAVNGNTQLVVSNGGGTLTLPGSPLTGGIVVGP